MKRTMAASAAILAASAGSALAQTSGGATTAPDMTALSGAVDFSTVGPAILAAGALGLTIKLAMVAVKYVRRVVGGA
jgi:uncharacterized membrane protein (DUF4010 family)